LRADPIAYFRFVNGFGSLESASSSSVGNFVPDTNFVELLAATARRGVEVRILTAGPKTDTNFVRRAGRGTYDALLNAGVRIYEWQPTALHARTFVVDGEWSVIASMNFDNRSMALNDESTLMVLDRGLGAQMIRLFLDDLQHATEITRAEFSRRPWRSRLAERAANLLTRIL
jgi:cardiolipin synthase A/B